MIIDLLADLHGHYPELEGGDLLIVAGDLTASDRHEEYMGFIEWINRVKYKDKIIVAGNHDNILSVPNIAKIIIQGNGVKYLCDSGTEFEGLKIWGSPWTRSFKGMNPRCKAFVLDTEEQLAEKFALIPNDIDILVTHSPPLGYLDHVPLTNAQKKANVNPAKVGMGSSSLIARIWEIDDQPKFKKKLMVCGHIHEGYGKILISNFRHDRITWLIVNASHVNDRYEPVNKPIRVIL